MTEILHVKLGLEPMGKQRPVADCRALRKMWKLAQLGARLGRFVVPGIVTPDESQRWERKAALLIRHAYEDRYGFGAPLLDRPLEFHVTAIHSRPKRMLAKKYPDGRIEKPTKPDWDNIEKICGDACTPNYTRLLKKEVHPGIWRDDALVCHSEFTKWWAARGEKAHVEIWIGEWPPACLVEPEPQADLFGAEKT